MTIVVPLSPGAAVDIETRLYAQKMTEKQSVATAMRNVRYHFTDSILIDIRWVDGHLVAQGDHDFPIFDDANSFRLVIDSANMAISTDAITHC